MERFKGNVLRILQPVLLAVGISISVSSGIVGCTKSGESVLNKASEIIIQPGDLLQVSAADFYEFSDKDFAVYLREVGTSNKLKTIIEITPSESDRKLGDKIHKTIVPKGLDLQGVYVVEVVMENHPELKLNSLYIPDEIIKPSIASSLAWAALTSTPVKSWASYSKEDIVKVYDWIQNYIPNQKKIFGVDGNITFPQLYKFLQNGLANNLDFINFLNSLGTDFNYDQYGNYVNGPILFSELKYSPLLDPTLTRPTIGAVNLSEQERVIFQTFGRDLSGDMVFYSWQLLDDNGQWGLFDTGTNVTSWTPAYGTARKTAYKFRVLVSNGGPFSLWNGEALPSWDVYVSPNVRAPSITESNCLPNAYVQTEWKCTIKGEDPSGFKLKWKVYPSADLYAYAYVNGIKIDNIADPAYVEGNTITLSFTPLMVDGKMFPRLPFLVRLVNEPAEYPELARTASKTINVTINDTARPPVFQAMARPYSNTNPVVTGYDPGADQIVPLKSQSPSFVVESFINKTLNDYEFGPLREWDQVCDKDPDKGYANGNPKASYHFQVKVKSLDDALAAAGAKIDSDSKSDIDSKASDHLDKFQLMLVDQTGLTAPNESLEQVKTFEDAPNPVIDLEVGNYNPTDNTTTFYFKLNRFDTADLIGKKYQIKVCSDHTEPPPTYSLLCTTLNFGFVVEARTPCVNIAVSGATLTTDESNKPPASKSAITNPSKMVIQSSKTVSTYQDCSIEKCSLGTDLQLEFIPEIADLSDPNRYDILSELPFIQNMKTISKLFDLGTNTTFLPFRNDLADPLKFVVPYPYIDPDYPRAARQEINISAYAIVPGYVALKSKTNQPEIFSPLYAHPLPSYNMPKATKFPLPMKNRLLANYSVNLPGTGLSRSIRQYFMIPTSTRSSSTYYANTLCKIYSSPTTFENVYNHNRLVDYTPQGYALNKLSMVLDPVLEIATPLWPCFPGEYLTSATAVELLKLSTDSNDYSGMSAVLMQGTNNGGHLTHYPLEIGDKGLPISFMHLSRATPLPSMIPAGTYFLLTKTINSPGNSPGVTFYEDFIFKTLKDHYTSAATSTSVPVTLAWDLMKVPAGNLAWSPETWNFSFTYPTTGETINVTDALWTLTHKEFYPFMGWNRFDVNTKGSSKKAKIKLYAANRQEIGIGEIVKFSTTEPIVKKLTANAAPVSVTNELDIYGNSGKIKIFNNSTTDAFTFDPTSDATKYLKFKSSNGAYFILADPTAAITVAPKSDLEVNIVRTNEGVSDPVFAFGIGTILTNQTSLNEFIGGYPYLTVTNANLVSGNETQLSFTNTYTADIVLDIDLTKIRSKTGIQLALKPVDATRKVTIPKGVTTLLTAERDYNQTQPTIVATSEVSLEYKEKDTPFSVSSGSTLTTKATTAIPEQFLYVYENTGTPEILALKDLYEPYEFSINTTTSDLPPSCKLVSGALPATCSAKLCMYPNSVDSSCSLPCDGSKIIDSRYCYFKFTPTADDVHVNGSAYKFNFNVKGKAGGTSPASNPTIQVTVTEDNKDPVLSFLNADPSMPANYTNSSKWVLLSTLGTVGASTSNPFDTSIQDTYGSSLPKFTGFIENQSVVAAKDNSYRFFTKTETKTNQFSSLTAKISEFWYYDQSNVLVKEVINAAVSPGGIPAGVTLNGNTPTNNVAMNCITLSGDTTTSCQDALYGSYNYLDIKWIPNDLQAKKYSHTNGIIMKLDICSACGTSNSKTVSMYLKFLVKNINADGPSFISSNGSAFTITSSDPNNILEPTDKSEIKVYADSFVKFQVTVEDPDGSSPLGSSWSTVLSLCRLEIAESDSHICNFDTWYGTDYNLLNSRKSDTYAGNKYLSDGLTVNSDCRDASGNLKLELTTPRVTAGAVTTGTAGKKRYVYTIEWCPQRGHLGKYSGSIFAKDFGDKDRQNNLETSKEKSTVLKFNVVSRPFFISPRYDVQTGLANHYMRQAYAGMTEPFKYYLVVNNTLKNALSFTVASPYNSTAGCTVDSTKTLCSLVDDADTTDDVQLQFDPKTPDIAVLSWKPSAADKSPSLLTPTTFRVQVKDKITGLADNVTFSVVVKDNNYANLLYGGNSLSYERAPKIDKMLSNMKDHLGNTINYEQSYDGTSYSYPLGGNPIVAKEGQEVQFSLQLPVPPDENTNDYLFVRWFVDGVAKEDNDLSAGEPILFKYTGDNSAGGSYSVVGGQTLRNGYHVIRAELTDGALFDYREWVVKVRNTELLQSVSPSFDLLATRKVSSPAATNAKDLLWSQELLVNYSPDVNVITDYLVVSSAYTNNSVLKHSLWNIPFMNGVAQLTSPPLFNENFILNPFVTRLDYAVKSGGFKVFLTSQAARLAAYQPDGSNSLSVDLPQYLGSPFNPCYDICADSYFSSGDDGNNLNAVVDRGSGDILSLRFRVIDSVANKSKFVYATMSANRKSLTLDQGNLFSKTDISMNLAAPSQLEGRALVYSPEDKILYIFYSNSSSTLTPAQTLIKRIDFSAFPSSSTSSSNQMVFNTDYVILPDINVQNAAANFDFKIQGGVIVPSSIASETKKYRIVASVGSYPGSGGGLMIVDPNLIGTASLPYKFIRDTSNTFGASTSDIPGKGRRLIYDSYNQVVIGLVKDANQFFTFDPISESVVVTSGSVGVLPFGLVNSPSGLILMIDRTNGRAYNLK